MNLPCLLCLQLLIDANNYHPHGIPDLHEGPVFFVSSVECDGSLNICAESNRGFLILKNFLIPTCGSLASKNDFSAHPPFSIFFRIIPHASLLRNTTKCLPHYFPSHFRRVGLFSSCFLTIQRNGGQTYFEVQKMEKSFCGSN